MAQAILIDIRALIYGPTGADLLSEILRGEGIAAEPADVARALDQLPPELGALRAAMRTEEEEDQYNRMLVHPLVEALGVRSPTDALLIRLAETLHEYHAYLSLYPETLPVLQTLAGQGIKLGVLSNWAPSLGRLVREFELGPFLGVVLSSAEVGISKPDPFVFERALRQLGAAPEEALHAGPSLQEDVAGAMRSGITPVWVNRTGITTGHEVLTVTDLRGLLMLAKAVQ